MKLTHDSASYYILRLLLLAELIVHSTPRPAPSPLCGLFGSMVHQVEHLMNTSNRLHELSSEELPDFDGVKHKLDLPQIQHTASHFNSLKVNESLSQLFTLTQSFKLHVDWLKTARDNFSLSSQSAEGASTRLLRLSNSIKTSLQQLSEDVPQPPPPPSPPPPPRPSRSSSSPSNSLIG